MEQNLRSIKMNVKTTKAVLVGSRTDMLGKIVPDGGFGNWDRSLAELRPCPWYNVLCATEERSRRCDGPQLTDTCWYMPDIDSCASETSAVRHWTWGATELTAMLLVKSWSNMITWWKAHRQWRRLHGGGHLPPLLQMVGHRGTPWEEQ